MILARRPPQDLASSIYSFQQVSSLKGQSTATTGAAVLFGVHNRVYDRYRFTRLVVSPVGPHVAATTVKFTLQEVTFVPATTSTLASAG